MGTTLQDFESKYMDERSVIKLSSFDDVRGYDPHFVWTLVRSSKGVFLMPGFHGTNANIAGYVLTPEPWNRDSNPMVQADGWFL